MRCLTKEECASWVAEHGMIAFPYGDWNQFPELAAGYYRQLNVQSLRSDWSQYLIEAITPFQSALLWIIDEGWNSPPLDALVSAVRRSHGEQKPVEATPGHLCVGDEADELAGLFFLTMAMGGCAYLYVADSRTIFYNWEGDLVDTWTKNERHRQSIEELQGQLQPNIVSRGSE